MGQTDPFIPDLSDVKIGILHLGNAIYELLNITELAISNGRGVLAVRRCVNRKTPLVAGSKRLRHLTITFMRIQGWMQHWK